MSKKNNKKIIKGKLNYALKLEEESQRKRQLKTAQRKLRTEAKEAF